MAAGFNAVRPLLTLIGINRNDTQGWPEKASEDADELANVFIREIESIGDDDVREDIMRELVRFLARHGHDPAEYRRGELALYQDGAFHPIRFIGKANSWIFSIDFSKIGRIDILIKDLPGSCFISIFCPNDGVLEALLESRNELLDKFKSEVPPVHINFYNMRNTVNKIVEIYSYYHGNSVFDVKA
jgi:hypothetical protein